VLSHGGSTKLGLLLGEIDPISTIRHELYEELFGEAIGWLARTGEDFQHGDLHPLFDYFEELALRYNRFSFKGQTLRSVRKRMTAWHDLVETNAIANHVFEPRGVKPFTHLLDGREWTIEEISDTRTLARESSLL